MKRNIKIGIIIFLGLCIITILGLYAGRNALLRYYVNDKIKLIEQKYGLKIDYRALYMPNINTVEMDNVSIVPHYRDTLLVVRTLQTELDMWKLLRADINIKRITSVDITINFVKRNGISNFDFLFRQEKVQETGSAKETDFARYTSEVLKLAFGFLPGNGEIRNFSIGIQRDSSHTEICIPLLQITDHRFSSQLIVCDNGQKEIWKAQGILQNKTKTIEARLSVDSGKIHVPYINRYYGARIAFNSLSFQLTEKQEKDSRVSLSGKASITELEVFHKSLSSEIVNLNDGSFDYHINIGKNFIVLDSATILRFNQLEFSPYIRAERQGKWRVVSSVNKPWFPASELFSSLPEGLFNNLEGIKIDGKLSYHLLLDVDFNLLDNLKLESELKAKDFRITGYGLTDLRKMNEEFVYTAYEQGNPVRTFAVGPLNPHFTILDSISPLLQMSVLQSEDGAFYYHQGFLIDAMREALIHDLKVNRFARGGSTITMQLVKNVFLNRNKNIARKLEEALIVWLIETGHLTTKQRMFEVYMNIIEWGPLIYGACEASYYYFSKHPSQLTGNEAIFLASIIPKPKRFRSLFGADMKLKENMEGYYRLIAGRLLMKGLITEEEEMNIRPEIEITGEAKHDIGLLGDSLKNVVEERMDRSLNP